MNNDNNEITYWRDTPAMCSPWVGLGWSIQAALLFMRGLVSFLWMTPVVLLVALGLLLLGVATLYGVMALSSEGIRIFGGSRSTLQSAALVITTIATFCAYSLPTVFAGGLVMAVDSVAKTGSCSIGQLFAGFRDEFWTLFRVYYWGALSFFALSMGMAGLNSMGLLPSWLLPFFVLSQFFIFFIAPVPLVMLHGTSPWRAIWLSILGALKNIIPVLCFWL